MSTAVAVGVAIPGYALAAAGYLWIHRMQVGAYPQLRLPYLRRTELDRSALVRVVSGLAALVASFATAFLANALALRDGLGALIWVAAIALAVGTVSLLLPRWRHNRRVGKQAPVARALWRPRTPYHQW